MRCYNGCPDSQLQNLLDKKSEARKRLKQIRQDARCCYFPAEGKWQVFVGNTMVEGTWLSDEIASIEQAIKKIRRKA
jgi:hypothetical protein